MRKCKKNKLVKVITFLFVLIIITGLFTQTIQFIIPHRNYPDFNNYSETRANDTVNYTQVCLFFIQDNYPNKTIERVSSYIDGPDVETGYIYTVLFADLIPGEISPSGDPVLVSVRHDTLNVEFGRDQLTTDYTDYYNALPTYYKKLTKETRQAIIVQLNYLPLINDNILSSYSTNAQISFNTSYLNQIKDAVSEFEYQILDNNAVEGNFTLKTIFLLCNESYVNGAFFYSIYPYQSISTTISLYYILFPLLLVIIITVLYMMKRKR